MYARLHLRALFPTRRFSENSQTSTRCSALATSPRSSTRSWTSSATTPSTPSPTRPRPASRTRSTDAWGPSPSCRGRSSASRRSSTPPTPTSSVSPAPRRCCRRGNEGNVGVAFFNHLYCLITIVITIIIITFIGVLVINIVTLWVNHDDKAVSS
ncbi:protein lateral organ boundaries [Phtheirospermum japonicum]|uniref:Protein lateral organ boundaries n=1 Tax=Phtheirospermum japonicum TaxID=374723 RepID=A0A830DA25_9LAMI|nr:protein lateral organ boundaries [Phtheirospermum japonicum]